MRTLLVAVWIAVVPTAAYAGRPLSLKEALDSAREHNKDLKAAQAHLAQSKVGVEQAWTALQPTVALQGKYTHNYKGAELPLAELNQGTLGLAKVLQGANDHAPPTVQNPALDPALTQLEGQLNGAGLGTITIQKEEQLDGSLTVSVPLLVPPAYANLNAAKETYSAAQANFVVSDTSVLYSVAQTFFAAAGADELMAARKNAVEVAKRTVKDSRVKFESGTARSTDLNRAEVSLLQAQQQLLEAEDTQRQAYRSLSTLIQLPGDFTVAAPQMGNVAGAPLDELVQKGLQDRPELRFYAQSEAAASAQESSADWRWSPTLSAFGRATIANYAGFTGDYYSWAVGVELDWTIYDAGQRTAAKHLAEAQRAEAEAHLAAAIDSTRNEIQNAMDQVRTSRTGVQTAEQSRALSARTLDLTRVQYEAGIATQLDVLQAQDTLVGSSVQLAQARFNLALAQLAVERSAGLFPEDRL